MSMAADLEPAALPRWSQLAQLPLTLLAAGAIWLGGLLPAPWGAADRHVLQMARVPALAVAALLAVSWLSWSALRTRSREPLPAGAGAEEPLLGTLKVIACHSSSPVVVMAGMDKGAGVSTLTFNLGVALAVQGQVLEAGSARSARPICLLAESPLTEALGLSPMPLEEYFGRHPQRVDADLIDLPTCHASGCELLCLRPERRAGAHLMLLVGELRRLYDAVLVDGGRGQGQMQDAITQADALLLIGRHSVGLLETAGPWVERAFAMEIEHKTMLVLNDVAAWRPLPGELDLAFAYRADLPDEPAVGACDADGLPWCLDGRLTSARRLAEVVRRLFPRLVPEVATDVA